MTYEALKTGCVIFYPYLWKREADQGETSGRKERRTAVGMRLPRHDGHDALILFPITTVEPTRDQLAVEIPETEKRRAGLDRARRMWLIFEEYNYDEIGNSFYLEPRDPVGQFSVAFFDRVLQKVRPLISTLERVSRVE